MPSGIALFFSILFILFVYKLDTSGKSSGFSALWIPLIWMIFCISKSLSYWLDPGAFLVSDRTEIDYISGSPIDRNFLSVMMLAGLAILFKRRINWLLLARKNIWIFFFFLYMGASALWSNYSAVSFKRWIRTIGDLIMVLVIISEHDSYEALKWLFRRWAFLLLPLSIVLIKYYREIGVAYTYDGLTEMWVGVTTHKNSLGELSSYSAVFFIWSMITRRFRESKQSAKTSFLDVIFLCIALFLLAGSGSSRSSTAIGALLIGIAVLLLLHKAVKQSEVRRVGGLLGLGAIFLLCIQAISYVVLNASLLQMSVGALGRDMTFTGRLPLWEELIAIGLQHPLFGVGYGSFWIGNISHNLWNTFIWQPTQGHNGYIDVFVELGFIGLLLLLGAIISSFIKISRMLVIDYAFGILFLAIFAMIIVHNVTESSFTRPTALLWFLFLLISVSMPKSPIAKAVLVDRASKELDKC